MKIEEYYHESIKLGYDDLTILIEYLAFEKKVLELTDDEEKLTYYLQDRFHNKMNGYLAEYKKKRGA